MPREILNTPDGRRPCAQCHELKHVDDFNFYERNGKKYYTWCRPCTSQYNTNKARKNAPAMASLVQRKKLLVNELKAHPCRDCGRCFPPVAMDFDHVTGVKFKPITQLVGQNYSIESLLDEIAKCELVCACCHRVRTALRGRSAASKAAISRAMGGRPVQDQNGNVYDSVADAARKLGLTRECVRDVLRGRQNHTGGHSFVYYKPKKAA